MKWKFGSEETELAAKYFAIRNLAMTHMLNSDINGSWYRIQGCLEMDCGEDGSGEMQSWLDCINSEDCKYENDEWEKVREQYIA